MTTITTSTNTGIVLTSPAYTNPIVINPGVTISGPTNGVSGYGEFWTIQNYGSIAGSVTNFSGVGLFSGGSVTNGASGSITGWFGVGIAGGAGTVVNYGSIAGTGQQGVELSHGGLVTNAASASITGLFGVAFFYDPGTVFNDGSIAGTRGGVYLDSGGSVTNTMSASITSGYFDIHILGGTGTVLNDGTIGGGISAGTRGIDLSSGGLVTNAASGSITGSENGVFISGSAGTVVNEGSIGAGDGVEISSGTVVNDGSITGTLGAGVYFGPGSVTNEASASITGYSSGIDGSFGTVINDGSIAGTGTAGIGVNLSFGGSVTNTASGSIIAHRGVYLGTFGGTVVNEGRITATGTGGSGVELKSGGSVTNAAPASITGGVGVLLSAGGTLTNTGTIVGKSGTAIAFSGTTTNLLTLDPGYGLSGIAMGGARATNTLELASAASAGTLSGLGTEFVDFGETTIDAGASWVFNGANTIEPGTTLTELAGATLSVTGPLVDDGTIILDPSSLTVAALTGTGQVTIDAGSTLDVQGTVAAGQTIMFNGNGADLRLDAPDSAAGGVTNFAPGETIDLKGIAPASVSYAGGVLSFTGGGFPLVLASGGTVVATASAGGVAISVLCFCADTLILTPSGEHPIQALAVGDMVITHRGEARPIVWIGTRAIDCARHPDPSAVRPVCIRAGALADFVPRRDLYVSPDHAMLIDGALVPARRLCNGATIHQPEVRHAQYFHLELQTLDILLAEGAEAESYLGTGNRAAFENADAPMILHPDFAHGQHLRETRSRAPFAADAEPVWRRLAARALALGYAAPEPDTTDDPDLRLTLDGREIRPLAKAGNRYVFALRPSPGAVRLLSRTAAPCEAAPWIDDRRRLGVKMGRITLRNGQDVLAIPPDHPMLADGWWAVERDGARLGRWTNGDAALPVPLDAATTLEVEVGGTVPYRRGPIDEIPCRMVNRAGQGPLPLPSPLAGGGRGRGCVRTSRPPGAAMYTDSLCECVDCTPRVRRRN